MKRRSLRNSGLLTLTLGLGSCATTGPYKAVQLPAFAGAYFSECTGKDGSVSIEMFTDGKVQQIFDADWTSDNSGDWSLASYSPLGQTLFQLEYMQKKKAFVQTGKPFAELENLAIERDSLVSVDGHPIGLRVDEITCLLNHKLPQRWLKNIIAESSSPREIQYSVVDGKRAIDLSLSKHGNRSEEYWRANVSWSLYWGLKKMQVSIRLLRDEQALLVHSDQFSNVDVRIITQEE